MKRCAVCGGTNLAEYRYRDHGKRRNALSLWKLRGAYAALRLVESVPPLASGTSLHKDLLQRALFSSAFAVHVCNGCGYGRYALRVPRRTLRDYYRSAYAVDGDRPIETVIDDRAIGQFAFVAEFLRTRRVRAVLEIGAAAAHISGLIRNDHAEAAVDVAEPDQKWRAHYQKLGVRHVSDYFPFRADRRYDYIHMSHTLEHVPDLAATVRSLHAALASNGLVFIEVPNCTAEYWRECTDDPPGHIHYFTGVSLSALFQARGFEVLKLGTYGMTHSERNALAQGERPAEEKLALRSIRESLVRENAEYLRAVFKRE